MMIQEFYDELSPFYHLIFPDWEASIERQANILHRIIKSEWGKDVSTIVDVSCGIGTQAIGLKKRGYEVAASDLSPQAIERAREEAKKRGVNIKFSVSDMRKAFAHSGTGICYAKSHLFVALLRAQHIPAGLCYQVLRNDPPLNGMVLHGLSAVYMEDSHEWLLLDPRGNTNGCNAQVGAKDEGLAFQTNGNFGEFTYPMVYHCPASVVVNTLRAYGSRTKMWPHLPTGL